MMMVSDLIYYLSIMKLARPYKKLSSSSSSYGVWGTAFPATLLQTHSRVGVGYSTHVYHDHHKLLLTAQSVLVVVVAAIITEKMYNTLINN